MSYYTIIYLFYVTALLNKMWCELKVTEILDIFFSFVPLSGSELRQYIPVDSFQIPIHPFNIRAKKKIPTKGSFLQTQHSLFKKPFHL